MGPRWACPDASGDAGLDGVTEQPPLQRRERSRGAQTASSGRGECPARCAPPRIRGVVGPPGGYHDVFRHIVSAQLAAGGGGAKASSGAAEGAQRTLPCPYPALPKSARLSRAARARRNAAHLTLHMTMDVPRKASHRGAAARLPTQRLHQRPNALRNLEARQGGECR